MEHTYILCAAVRADANTPPFLLLHQCTACGLTRLTTRVPPAEDYWYRGAHLTTEAANEPCQPGRELTEPAEGLDETRELSS